MACDLSDPCKCNIGSLTVQSAQSVCQPQLLSDYKRVVEWHITHLPQLQMAKRCHLFWKAL